MGRKVKLGDATALLRTAIGERLRLARQRLGETQTQFADRMGVTPLSLSSYEAGVSCPRADQLQTLSQAGIDSEFIVTGVPSLALPEARRAFARALAWVRQECSVAGIDPAEETVVEAAWLVFSRFYKDNSLSAPDAQTIRDATQVALGELAG